MTQAARRRATGVAVGALTVSNVMSNRVLPDAAYVPWNLAVAAGLVALARGVGCRDEDLGLARADLGRGVRWGASLAAAVAGVQAGAWASARGRHAFDDRRVTDLDPAAARFQALVRIPLGTALAEEVVFRGVLPALFSSSRRPWLPALASSALFGLWHVLPSQALVLQNQGAGHLAARAGVGVVPAVTVATMATAGAALYEVRRRGRHLAAPVLVHLAVNLAGFVGARATMRGGRAAPAAAAPPRGTPGGRA